MERTVEDLSAKVRNFETVSENMQQQMEGLPAILITLWQEQRQAADNPSPGSEHSSIADIVSNSDEVKLQLRGGGSVPLEELDNPSVRCRPPPSPSPDPHSVNPAWLNWTITKFDGSSWILMAEQGSNQMHAVRP